ncbi:MAG TPA: DUF971 domain-containing protein [Acidobacteriaceae bacterium]|jgi:DUF971 family protein|nr:DUF971 domain-containing protein [Acidobacteriaceae bacterium]
MSHEGIRFVSEETARKENANSKELPREATVPLHVRVHKTEGTGVEIDWKDGHHSQWSFAWLRDACPCATCNEERENEDRQPGQPRPKPANLLPMYKAPVQPDKINPVGRYAISFDWNDGHHSGIFSWDYLRRVCQCDECVPSKS